jgi:uncharacterized membrane protein (DUF441 family)
MIHKRRGGGLGWNWLALAAGVLCIVLVATAGAIELDFSPVAAARLLVGALVGVALVRKATRRTSAGTR